jgi:large exoprotein involved in heme utilization and adhesion
LRNSSLVSTSVFNGEGGGGDITFTGTDPSSSVLLALEDSDILATAQFGPGGNITSQNIPVFIYDQYATAIVPNTLVDARGFRGNLRVDISASSEFGTSGVVDVPDINTIESSLSALSGNFLSPDQVVAGSCLAQRNAEQGSFTVTGTGGLQRTPYDAIRGDYPVTDVQPIEDNPEPDNQSPQSKLPIQDSSWKLGDPVQEAQGMMVTLDGRIIAGTTPQQVAAANADKLICHPD